jgi:hypothetical protein
MAVSEYAAWVRYFRSLQPDVICLLPDEAEHQLDRGRFLPDRRSRVFAATGYSPILPLVLREKAALTHSALLGAAARLADAVDVEAVRTVDAPIASDAALRNAILAARAVAGRGVVLVLPPAWNETTFEAPVDERGFRTVRLGADPGMSSPELRLDGYHLSAGGHSRAAEMVAPVVLDLIHATEGAGR